MVGENHLKGFLSSSLGISPVSLDRVGKRSLSQLSSSPLMCWLVASAHSVRRSGAGKM